MESADSLNTIPIPEPNHFHVNKLEIVLIATAMLLAIGGFFIFNGSKLNLTSSPGYYEFVPDKISISAAIPIHLPKGININVAEASLNFEFYPEISGSWITGETEDYLYFKPDQKLDVGKYYSVTLATEAIKLQKDFLADEDPKIITVFPNTDTEASEYSKITIIFNRPMVPLTILDELQNKEMPIEITPSTPGKYKWITTRNLQFIPESRLVRSTHYTVKIKPGFVSMDNLSVSVGTYKFDTRPLRYESTRGYAKQYIYSQPIRFVFNQPIDITKTTAELTITNNSGSKVEFIASYGTREIYNSKTRKYEKYLDKSILEIYNKADSHGRAKLWDFKSYYTYKLEKAYPLEGDIVLNQSQSSGINISDIISEVTSESPRSKYVEPDIFDPEGKLWVTFFEDIDKDSSRIKAQNLKEIGYGEKCREPGPGEETIHGRNCEKVPDFKKIYITFDPSGIQKGSKLNINFEKIINKYGIQLNTEVIIKSLDVYKELIIYKTAPTEGAINADLTELIICTSNPLQLPDKDTFYERIKSNMTVGLWNWYIPRRIRPGDKNTLCSVGQFENRINYGLVPEFPYEINLNLIDDFDQSVTRSVHFTTGKILDESRRFFGMQKEYNVTSPERTKFVYVVDNLEYVNLHICEVSPETMLSYIMNRPDAFTPGGNLNCNNVIERRIDLPKKYWSRVYFDVNLTDYLPNPIGHYILTFSHPDYKLTGKRWDPNQERYVQYSGAPVYERTYVTVTNLAVQEKKVNWSEYSGTNNQDVVRGKLAKAPRNLYWVSEFGSLAPVQGASVSMYEYTPGNVYKKRDIALVSGSYFTGPDGIALTHAVQDLAAAIVKKGNDSTFVSEAYDRLEWSSYASAALRAYLYTDRPIYRPGHQVFIKGIYRLGYDSNYEIPNEKSVDVEIRNSRYEVISKQSVNLSEYGTFTANLTLDQSAPLGTYSVSAPGGRTYFDVEEYVPAAFQVEATSDKDEYIAGDTLNVTINANYYFGVPVDEGTVEYSVASQNYYFDRYKDEYINFGRSWYYYFGNYYGDNFVLRNTGTIDNHGKAVISLSLDFDKFFAGEDGTKSKIFTMMITAKNRSGQSISTQKSFIVHRGEIYAGINMDNTFVGKNDEITARVKTVDTEGKNTSVRNIKVEVKKVTWETYKRQEVDGNYYYQNRENKIIVKEFTLNTDGDGNTSYKFSLADEGEYEVSVSAKDKRGNTVISSRYLFVYGSGPVTVRSTNNETLDLATDKKEVEVGENVKIIIKSPYERAKALVSIERGTIFEYHVIDVNSNFQDFNFKVKDEFVPNFYVSILLLSSRPEIKYGKIQYLVNTKGRELNITVKPEKNNYLPGEIVNLNVIVKDSKGNPVSSEISLSVVDMSVLALSGNPKKNPVSFFYNGSPLVVSTESNIKNILYEADIPIGTKGGAGGGASAEDLAKKKRGVFKDTALWNGTVLTNAAGKANISFTLPDNLTTWQIESVGVTKNTQLGVGYGELQTQKNLMVVPLKPRFVIPGDVFSIGGQIFNNTDSKLGVDISITSNTLTFKGDKSLSVSIPSRSSKNVYFHVVAPENMQDGIHSFIISAKSNNLEDTVENTIKITRNDTYESVATANYTGANQSNEYVYLPEGITPDKGGVTIKTNATLAVFISDALNYLVQYPYGGSEQIASKLGSLGIVKRGLNIKNIGDAFNLEDIEFQGNKYSIDDVVRIGLARLYENQTYAGGFTYYTGMEPDVYLTISVLNSLIDLKLAGYDIDNNKINAAAKFLNQQITSNRNITRYNDFVILAAYTLNRIEGFAISKDINNRIITIANDTKYINEGISNTTLAYLAMLLTNDYSKNLKDAAFKQLENRIVIDSRGAYIARKGNATLFYEYYQTPIKDTALLLKAFAKDKRENVILDKVLRFLLASRYKDGAWGSTNNSVTVIDALTDFLMWKKENKSSFNLEISLGNNSIGEFTFNKDTIMKTFEKYVPITDIGLGTMKNLVFSKTNLNAEPNNYYYDILLKYYLPIQDIPERDEGFSIARKFYNLDDTENKEPVLKAKQGDVLRGHLTITVPESRNLVAIEDFIPAGMELINFNLATEDQSLRENNQYGDYFYDYDPYHYNDYYYEGIRGSNFLNEIGLSAFSSILDNLFNNNSVILNSEIQELSDDYYGNKRTVNSKLYPDSNESHDDRLFMFKQNLRPGVYEYDYFVRALIPGSFHHLPAVVSEMYFPENFGRTEGASFEILSNE